MPQNCCLIHSSSLIGRLSSNLLLESARRRYLSSTIASTYRRLFLSSTCNTSAKITEHIGIGIHQKRCFSTTQHLGHFNFMPQNPRPLDQTVGYYITMPNVPDESPENNIFLESIAQNNKWPPLQSATPDEMYEGTVKLILEYGASVLEQMDLMEEDAKKAEKGDPDVPKRTFDNTILPVLAEEYDVYYAVNTLLLKMLTDWPECPPELWREDFKQIQTSFARELNDRWVEPAWVEAVKQAYENEDDKLEPWQKRYLEWMILQARLSGYLTVKDRKKEKKAARKREVNYSWHSMLNTFSSRFLCNVWIDRGVKVPIEQRHLLKHAPPIALQLLSKSSNPEIGPWEAVSSRQSSLFAALNYCSSREVRHELWNAHVTRASFRSEDMHQNNSINIEELRHNCEGFAKAQGFNSSAEHRISTKMAGSPQTVRTFVDELIRHFRPVFLERIESAWSNFAEEGERIISEPQAFDLFYICRREAEHKYGVNTLELMNYFPVWPTFEKMLQLSSRLLNIGFKEVTDESEFERCHPSVHIFDVTDKATNERLGFLYVDIFSRKEKKKTTRCASILGRPASQIRSLDKLVYLFGSLTENGVLHHEEMSGMLSALGRALHLLFSRSPCHFLALLEGPYYASDFDASDFMPAFLQFCLYKPQLLESLSSPSVKTGKELGTKRAIDTAKCLQRATFWDSYRTLFWTDFDITIFSMPSWKKKFWLDLYKEMYAEYFPTFQEKYNFQPSSFITIFCHHSYSGLFYRKLWVEMLALDVHDTYDKEGDMTATGDRLKADWLNYGSMELHSELYRKFQGRDPNMAGINKFYGPEPAEDNTQTQNTPRMEAMM